eukprot:5121945-Prymnesium_polylepis.1
MAAGAAVAARRAAGVAAVAVAVIVVADPAGALVCAKGAALPRAEPMAARKQLALQAAVISFVVLCVKWAAPQLRAEQAAAEHPA